MLVCYLLGLSPELFHFPEKHLSQLNALNINKILYCWVIWHTDCLINLCFADGDASMKNALQLQLAVLTAATALCVSLLGSRADINLNTATRFQLESIPGIGPSLTSKIILERNRRGGYRSMDDLLKIPGIGRNTLRILEKYFYITTGHESGLSEDNTVQPGSCRYPSTTECKEETMINSVTLIGRLGQDPELRTTENGTSIANFSLAHNEIRLINGNRETVPHWFRCVAFGSLAQLCVEYLHKGSRIGISGSLKQRSWETDDGNKRNSVEILVKDIEFLSANPNRNGDGENAE
jgi:single-strand DNA-binding protein